MTLPNPFHRHSERSAAPLTCHSERSRGISRADARFFTNAPERCFDFASGYAQHDNPNRPYGTSVPGSADHTQ